MGGYLEVVINSVSHENYPKDVEWLLGVYLKGKESDKANKL